MPDPNWLYSTTAQCAAAIVAIIGGFLVSRVVAIGSEKSALLRRREELTEAVERYEDTIKESREEMKGGYGEMLDTVMGLKIKEHEKSDAERRETLREINRESISALAAARAELRVVNGALGRIGKPEGVVTAIWVLAALAAVGIVWPLIALSLRPVPSAWGYRFATIVAFAAGLGGVISFMLDAVRNLDHDRTPAVSVTEVIEQIVAERRTTE